MGGSKKNSKKPEQATSSHAKGEKESSAIVLPARLDISFSETFYNQLKSAAEKGNVVVDASAVERAATPCIQLLLAATKTAKENSIKFSMINISSALAEACKDLGLVEDLKGWGASV